MPKRFIDVLLRSILLPIAAALLMAFVWDLLDWMRSYGSGLPLFPQLLKPPDNLAGAAGARSCFGFDVARLIDWFNCTFLGAARFGTALGLVWGGIYVLCTLGRCSRLEKYAAATVIGAMIGGRCGLLLSSSAHIFLGSLVLGATLGCLSIAASGSSLSRQPLVEG